VDLIQRPAGRAFALHLPEAAKIPPHPHDRPAQETTMVRLTETAAREVKRLLQMEKKEEWGLRLGVAGGGCSGLNYTMAFDEKPNEDDTVGDVDGVRVFIDPKAYLFLNGMEIDYSTDLLQGGFRFLNPNAKRTCSCGTSFSV
jgi:iron-sulfur cluster assembly protein